MRDKRIHHRGDEGIAALAEAQHGVVSAAQLYALGLSRDQVTRRVRSGWLQRVHRGVYSVGHRPSSAEGRWMAATLSLSGAVLSHVSAAGLWGIVSGKSGWGKGEQPGGRSLPDVHLIKPGLGGMRPRGGLVLHRTTTIRDGELGTHRGIPVTLPGRTLLDLATAIVGRPLERAIDEAERLRLCNPAELETLLNDHHGEPGTGPLGRLLQSHAIGSTVTRSELEERFLALCRDHRLPQPLVNARLHDLTVDFLWADAKLVAELDGRQSHATRRAFQDDRDRDSLLAAHGYLTLRFTWRDVTRRPAVVTHRLRRVLADRRGTS